MDGGACAATPDEHIGRFVLPSNPDAWRGLAPSFGAAYCGSPCSIRGWRMGVVRERPGGLWGGLGPFGARVGACVGARYLLGRRRRGGLSSRAVPTPRRAAGKVSTHQQDILYREAVTGTWSDIMFTVTALSQFMQNPGHLHWEAVKRVLQYLKGTRKLWLVYSSKRKGLQGYLDTDWGSSTEHRHSIRSYVFTLDGAAPSRGPPRSKMLPPS